MKKNKIIKDFKSVNFMRDIRDKINKDIYFMNYDEIIKYFDKKN